MTPRTQTRAELLAELPDIQAAIDRAFAHFDRDGSDACLDELRRVLAAAERHCARLAVTRD